MSRFAGSDHGHPRRILSPTVALRRNAVYKCLLGGSRLWMPWAPWFGHLVLQASDGTSAGVVAKEVLAPGQTVCIEAIPPPAAAERSDVRRTRKQSSEVLLRNRAARSKSPALARTCVADELDLNRESHLVIRNGRGAGRSELLDDDIVEIRPVISGGA